MKQLAERLEQASAPVSAADAVKEYGGSRVDRARKELRTLQSTRDGSLESVDRDSLADKLEDAPLAGSVPAGNLIERFRAAIDGEGSQ